MRCALGPGSLVLIIGPAVEVMVLVAISILVSSSVVGTQPVCFRPGFAVRKRLVAGEKIGAEVGGQHRQKTPRPGKEIHPAVQICLRLQDEPCCAPLLHSETLLYGTTADSDIW